MVEEKNAMAKAVPDDIPPCLIRIDKEGTWYHKGAEIIHREIVQLFMENLVLDSNGRYVIEWQGDHCYVEVEDTVFSVVGINCHQRKRGQKADVMLFLNDGAQEELRPESLWVGKGNVLYCRVKEGVFPARFARPAYYQLAAHIEEGEDGFYLPLNDTRYPIPKHEQDGA
jgi:hypothetical protein